MGKYFATDTRQGNGNRLSRRQFIQIAGLAAFTACGLDACASPGGLSPEPGPTGTTTSTGTPEPTKMPEPKYHFIFPSTSTRADKENGHWKSKDWTWIRNESGVLRLSEDAELGTVIRYIVGENKNDDNVVRIVPSKEGPIIPGSFEMTIPVKFSENYLPKKGPGNRWVNFLSVFDQTPNFAPDYSLIASINDEQGELAVVSKDYYGDPYKMGRAGYRLEPETWHMLTVRSISET